jgi:hypothetical protein
MDFENLAGRAGDLLNQHGDRAEVVVEKAVA